VKDKSDPAAAAKKRSPRRAKRAVAAAPARALGQGASGEANRRAAAILEVLAGERSPRQVAAALGISLPYFYLLERKALAGLVRACEPQPKGPSGPSAAEKLAAAERRLGRAERECQRLAALVRATQRAVGLPTPPPPVKEGKKSPGRAASRRVRRPVVRALRAAETLRKNSSGLESPHGLEHSSAPPESGDRTGVAASGPFVARTQESGVRAREESDGG
jgi:hypothetical protein